MNRRSARCESSLDAASMLSTTLEQIRDAYVLHPQDSVTCLTFQYRGQYGRRNAICSILLPFPNVPHVRLNEKENHVDSHQQQQQKVRKQACDNGMFGVYGMLHFDLFNRGYQRETKSSMDPFNNGLLDHCEKVAIDLIQIIFSLNGQKVLHDGICVFVSEIRDAYFDCQHIVTNPIPFYHNFVHAVDVMQFMFLLLVRTNIRNYLDSTSQILLLITCLCHDIGHAGRDNQFLDKIKDPLVHEFGKESTLEKYHAATTIEIIKQQISSPVGIFAYLENSELHPMLDTIKKLIEATDMKFHSKYMKRFSDLSPILKKYSVFQQDEILDLMIFLIKCADISNVTRPWHLAQRWGTLLAQEKFSQGDEEVGIFSSSSSSSSFIVFNQRQMGLAVSMYCDRFAQVSLAQSSVSFYRKLAAPMFHLLASTFPDTLDFMWNTERNCDSWQQLLSQTE